MIHPYEITIGSILRTNKGEIIRVESISTKHQHRKVGYHTPDDPYRIKYVRLAQCEGIELTPEILGNNGFEYDKENREWRIDGISFLSGYDKWFHIADVSINLVHEFQFALIFEGLHELSDNFVV